MIQHIFLLLLFCAFNCIHADNVTAEAYIECDSSIKYWVGNLLVYEDDFMNRNDLVDITDFQSNETTKLIRFPPNEGGADPGYNYEIGYQLLHNCTHSGKTLCLQSQLIDVPKSGNQYASFYIKAYENGVEYCDLIEHSPI